MRKSKYGNIEVKIPRDRESTFEPKIIPKRQTLIEGTEDLILSLNIGVWFDFMG